MSNFQIHELTEKAINRNSNIIHDTLNSGSYGTGKNIVGAVADLASANVAAPYDTTVTYAIGQYCLYEGDIYRCIAITTGAFDSTKWTQIVVTGEFRRVVELTSAQYAQLTPAEQNNGTIYVKTDEETTAADIPYSSGVSVADKLDSLTTALNPTYSTTGLSTPSGITIQDGGFCIIGKLVLFNIRLNLTNTVATETDILLGLPTPNASYNNVAVTINKDTYAVLTTSGNVRVVNNQLTYGVCLISGTYLTI